MPLTTDYYPLKTTLSERFVRSSDYSLLLEVIREQYGFTNYDYNKKISMAQVFTELVGHRLAMGFQIVVPKNLFTYSNASNSSTASQTNTATNIGIGGSSTSSSSSNKDNIMSTTPTNSSMLASNIIQTHHHNTLASSFICDLSLSPSVIPRTQPKCIKGYYRLSLGRIFHEIFYMVDNSNGTEYVKVEIYVPQDKKEKNTNNSKSIDYKYRFQVPDSKTYDISICEMSKKSIESIKWNIIDSYICIQGNFNKINLYR